jgi:ferredoxin
MATKAWVKKDTCIACGVCPSLAPQIFGFGDDGLAENILDAEAKEAIPEDLTDLAEEAKTSCPVEAIVVE